MFSILLVSHGSVASSMIKSSGMLLGYREGIYAVEIDAYTVVDNLKKQLRAAITELLKKGKVVVLTDIPIGTPFNVVISLMEELDVIHFTGMNLPLVTELLLLRRENLQNEEDCRRALERARAKMFDVNEFCRHLRTSGADTENTKQDEED